MKKLILLILVSICLLSGCQKETVSLPADTTNTKVFIQIDALNADGTVNSSEIAIVD